MWQLAFLLAAAPAVAGEPDALRSPACVRSLARLEQLRERSAEAAAIEQARQAAAQACLQVPAGRPPQRALRPPVQVAPVPVPPLSGPPDVAPLPRPEPLAGGHPAVISHCDPGGCWDAQGRRLSRAGPQLLGPRGSCLPWGEGFVCP